MQPDAPFVQVKPLEIMDQLPMLTGCFAQVFMTIGVFEIDPIGLSAKDLFRFLGLSRPSVAKALDYLEHHELIHGKKDEHGVTRYRTCLGFYYRGIAKVDLRGHVNNLFTSPRRRSESIPSDSNENLTSTSNPGAQKILQSVNVFTIDLDLSEMDETRANLIAEYVRANPEKKNAPGGWVHACLKNNPTWEPQLVKINTRTSWLAGFEHVTHGTPEHQDYLRDHPELRAHCRCWDDTEESDE